VPAAIVIAWKDLRQRLRDRSAITIGLVAPLAVAAVMSFAFRGAEHFHMTVALVDRDNGALSTGFRSALTGPGLRDFVTVHVVDDVATASRQVKNRDVDAAFVIPPGFTDAAFGGRAAQLQVLSNTDARIAGEVAASIASSFAAQLDADRLSVATALATGSPQSQRAELVRAAATLRIPEQVVTRPTGTHPLKTISYYAPAMAIFFALFSVGFAGRSFFAERREGTLDRMLAAPVRPGAILLGKVLSVFAYCVGSLVTVLAVTGLFFGADWGNPLGVVVLCVAMAAAIVALSAAVIVFARTEQQVQQIGSVVVFTLAVLGGNFVTQSAESATMRRLALFTPNGWALRGFTDLATGARGVGDILTPVAGMLAFAVIVGAIAWSRASRALRA